MHSLMKVETRVCGDNPQPSAVPLLEKKTIHVWHRRFNPGELDVKILFGVLSKDERLRAESFCFEKHRDEFILSRSTLRVLLAGYLGDSPERVAFSYSRRGKPSLSSNPNSLDLHFNISHTDGWAAFTFARGIELGIDIEKTRADIDHFELAEQFFSEYEQDHLQMLSGEALADAFFRCWTRKEAYIKARGEGLSIPLHQFDVSLNAGQPAALLATRPDAVEASRWTLCDLPIHPEYVAALAWQRTDSPCADSA